eukprot:CAMPEP_0196809958 /NCGR_PEP_ID=MMETSP1362-20130617/9823_1 /TAXON_ID=163516 /ORGANISM="Leptocylindrus danicus, Strain CCMP1856" /LENGTH=684 /DNA_ID=CAMNT_0042184809 /DNA_START=58 /DNA_END=2112 /DNA_ORIENTATION=+
MIGASNHQHNTSTKRITIPILAACGIAATAATTVIVAMHYQRWHRKRRKNSRRYYASTITRSTCTEHSTTKCNQQIRRRHDDNKNCDIQRLYELFAQGKLQHPYFTADYYYHIQKQLLHNNGNEMKLQHADDETDFTRANFTDLSRAISRICGDDQSQHQQNQQKQQYQQHTNRIYNEIGGTKRSHVILILCDGMGSTFLNAENAPFLCQFNDPDRLRAVWPSTTAAALTTLATATWPGQHGMPGWDLRDTVGCDMPGVPNAHLHVSGDNNATTTTASIASTENSHANQNNSSITSIGPVQLRILAHKVVDQRSGVPAKLLGFTDQDVYLETPWARRVLLLSDHDHRHSGLLQKEEAAVVPEPDPRRRNMIFVNAYNGDEFPNWYQGGSDAAVSASNSNASTGEETTITEFSAWQAGKGCKSCENQQHHHGRNNIMVDLATIGETVYDTLGLNEGAQDAIQFFADGVNVVLERIQMAQEQNTPTFTYLYTAHPDKHMHALGVGHERVKQVIRGIDSEIERLWNGLMRQNLDAAIVVTADHGHVTVMPEQMVELPRNLLDCLEYANIGVHGYGRHAYLHCRTGLQEEFRRRWDASTALLRDNFLLLSIDEAIDEHLFGPSPPKLQVRPRLGDFVAMAIGRHTLATANEIGIYRDSADSKCVGAHGSLLPEEMNIPYIVLTPEVGS